MIIVTGGAGFIGSNIVYYLNQLGHEDILVVDDLEFGDKHRNLNALKITDYIDYRTFRDNISQYKNQKIEAIFHQGACSSTTESDGRYMMEVNYDYSKMMLAFATEVQSPFYYASSAAVYGVGKNGYEEDRQCEDPLNVYGFSKFLFDQHVRRILPKSKIQIVGLRYFNVYGPQENHKGDMSSVVFKFHHQIAKEGKLKIFEGSEKFLRDFIYIKDVVDVNLFFMNNPKISGIFNCGTGQTASFEDLAKASAACYDDATLEYIPFPAHLEGKYQKFTQASLTKLRAAGYSQGFQSVPEGVRAYTAVLKQSDGFYNYS